MTIPSPADFRNRTKKHSEMREMLAQMAGNVLEIDVANANPLFKPVRLDNASVVSEITTAGIYHVPYNTLATTLGLPSGIAGQLYVSGNTNPPSAGFVFQTYINTNGEVFQRIKTTTWSEWNGQSRRVLTGSDNLNVLIASGIYHASSSSIATLQNNYPFVGVGGIILVENSGNLVRQQMFSLDGVAQRWGSLSSGVVSTWTDWKGIIYKDGLTNLSQIDRKLEAGQVGQKVITNISEIGHLDLLTVEGEYFINSSAVGSLDNGFPISSGGFLTVKKNSSNNYHQEFRAYGGYAYRWGALIGSVVTWEPWSGVSTGGALENTADFLKGSEYQLPQNLDDYLKLYTIRSANVGQAPFNGHADNATTEGLYFLNSSGVSTTAYGFPFGGSSGLLTVIPRGAGTVAQFWQCGSGYAYRWGVLNPDKTVTTWNAWRGVKHSQDGIVDLYAIIAEVNAIIAEVNETKKKFVVFGSSTTYLLTDYFTGMCERKNLTYINHGINGDNLGGSGLAQGSNIVTLQFPDGIISATETQSVTVEASFGGSARHNRTVELSNGVRGTLYTDGTFKASNLTGDLIVDPLEKYRAIEPTWYDIGEGVYVFNIGKNDTSTADANYIFNNTLEMVEYLPPKAKSVVLGHFTDSNGNAERVAKIEEINNRLRLKFGLRYIDILELLFSDSTWIELGLTKTPADEAAILAKKLPPSLGRDNGHLSVDMSNILGRAVEDRLAFLGYI